MLLLTALLMALPLRAEAHAGAELTSIDHDREGVLETSFGVLIEEDEGWKWVCHEAVTQPTALLTPKYAFGPDGTMIATVPDPAQARYAEYTVYRSTDGCNWSPVEGLTELPISAVAFVDAQRLVAVTADLSETGRAAIFSSVDGGETWSEAATAPSGSLFVRVVASGEAVWTVSFDPNEPGAPLAWRSADGGQSWTSHAIDVSEWTGENALSLQAMAVQDADRAWLSVSAPTGHVLLHTDDAAESFSTVHTVEGSITDAGLDAEGHVWVIEASRGLWRSEDGLAFSQVGAPPAIGIGFDGTTALIATSAVRTEALLHAVEADGERTVLVDAEDLAGPLECAEESDQYQICAPLWGLVQLGQDPDPDPIPQDTDEPPTDPDRPCGCQSAPTAAWATWLALPLLLAARRR